MLNWLKKAKSNDVVCAKLDHRRKAQDKLNLAIQCRIKAERLLLKTLRQKACPLLREKLIAQTCQDVIDDLIINLVKMHETDNESNGGTHIKTVLPNATANTTKAPVLCLLKSQDRKVCWAGAPVGALALQPAIGRPLALQPTGRRPLALWRSSLRSGARWRSSPRAAARWRFSLRRRSQLRLGPLRGVEVGGGLERTIGVYTLAANGQMKRFRRLMNTIN